MLWSAGALVVLIAAVTILSNGNAAPETPVRLSGDFGRTRMLAAERGAAEAQAMAVQPTPDGTGSASGPTAPAKSGVTGVGTVSPAQAPAIPAKPTLPATAVWPLQGRVAMGYGWVFDPTGRYWFYHTGLEIAATPGAAVRAALPGAVAAVEREASGGFTIVVTSPQSVVTTYTGLAATSLAVGSTVGQGTMIGTMPQAGAGGVKLGFSIRRAGQPIDPASLLPAATAGASRHS